MNGLVPIATLLPNGLLDAVLLSLLPDELPRLANSDAGVTPGRLSSAPKGLCCRSDARSLLLSDAVVVLVAGVVLAVVLAADAVLPVIIEEAPMTPARAEDAASPVDALAPPLES